MPFDMYGDVILTRDVTERGLRAGDVGTVVERHVVPGVPEEGYSVEFFDMTGNTVAVVTLPASALRLPTPAERRFPDFAALTSRRQSLDPVGSALTGRHQPAAGEDSHLFGLRLLRSKLTRH
jgi:hypothetical protein